MIIEDLTTYTEVDSSGKIAVSSTRVTANSITNNVDSYVYKDFGASYFDKIDLLFDYQCAAHSGYAVMGFTNELDESMHWVGPYIAVSLQSGLSIYNGGTSHDSSLDLSHNITYYCRLLRQAGDDVVRLYIYSDAGRTTLVDTVTLAGFGTTKWRYFFPMTSENYSSPYSWSGYLENFVLPARNRARGAQLIGPIW